MRKWGEECGGGGGAESGGDGVGCCGEEGAREHFRRRSKRLCVHGQGLVAAGHGRAASTGGGRAAVRTVAGLASVRQCEHKRRMSQCKECGLANHCNVRTVEEARTPVVSVSLRAAAARRAALCTRHPMVRGVPSKRAATSNRFCGCVRVVRAPTVRACTAHAVLAGAVRARRS